MLFTPWSPHLNLPGRLRLQRPAYEGPIEAGALPRFEIPTAPTTRNLKSETFVTTRGDAEVLFQGMALQESFSRTQDFFSGLEYSLHVENQRHELQTVDIRSFGVREETYTTI